MIWIGGRAEDRGRVEALALMGSPGGIENVNANGCVLAPVGIAASLDRPANLSKHQFMIR
ncbi:hypothetical protein D3C87_2082540 [compost metagenome]